MILIYDDGTLWGMYGSSTSPANQYGCDAASALGLLVTLVPVIYT